MRLTWIKPEDLIGHELRQLAEEGRDVSALAGHWEAAVARASDPADLRPLAEELLAAAAALPAVSEDHEPSELAAIQALRPAVQPVLPPVSLSPEARADRVRGAWQGRAAGCLLGKPVEKVQREGVRAIAQATGNWPVHDWFTAVGLPDDVAARHPWNKASLATSLRENITCMPEDDDLNYTMLNLHVLETYGPAFTTDNVGEQWLKLMPVLTVFTAERIAYLNMLNFLEPPATATYRNPYREWIGAQIRADLFGYVHPGRPAEAAAMAWKDARLSHVKNGIYGEMFVAAMVAGAFVTSDPEQIIAIGLSQIPAESRLAEAVRFAAGLRRHEPDWESAVDRLYERYGHYHWVHTINNAALVTAALVYGEGDYERSICLAVMGGWDTDCNGATVGSILGAALGAGRLPQRWIAPLRNRIRTTLKGFDNSSFDDLAQRTLVVQQQLEEGAR